jgi:ABC-type protease/lipase transport system fused ATPase/permease subunit
MADATAMIASLPNGLETEVGEAGAHLSAGQRRRIALARALFGTPALVCLDEPEANLDREGEIALARALYHHPVVLLIDDVWNAYDRDQLAHILEFLKSRNATTIVVSNLIPVAAAMDRCVEVTRDGFINHGRIESNRVPEAIHNFMWN